MKSVLEQGHFHEFIFNMKVFKALVECQMCWKCSKFACCRMRTSSHPYYITYDSNSQYATQFNRQITCKMDNVCTSRFCLWSKAESPKRWTHL